MRLGSRDLKRDVGEEREEKKQKQMLSSRNLQSGEKGKPENVVVVVYLLYQNPQHLAQWLDHNR